MNPVLVHIAYIVASILFIYGLDWTLAGNSSLMLATTPIFTTLLSSAFRLERIAPTAWLGVVISAAGIALVVWGGVQGLSFSATTSRSSRSGATAATGKMKKLTGGLVGRPYNHILNPQG